MESVKDTAVSPLDALRWKKESNVPENNNSGQLGQEDFFALLTQQLAHQDPTKPVENNEMISQMTSFSMNAGIDTLNKSFGDFSSTMSSSQALQASSLVGRNVLVDNNIFGMPEGQGANGKISTDMPATNVVLNIENAAGEVIRTVAVGDLPKGEHPFTWDGKNKDGDPAATGLYRFRVAGNVDGEPTEMQAMTYRRVDSVTLAGTGGNVQLNLNDGESMALKDIVEISG
jgi:flagellar basal-body rod modification protein FlgD